MKSAMIDSNIVTLHERWRELLAAEFDQPYFTQIKAFILSQKQLGKEIYPPSGQIFYAFNLTPFEMVRVVIIGQDPYHGAGQAHGLSFSVPIGIKPPPSLANIYKELYTDCGLPIATHGNLVPWAKQGVLLLNAVLTVNAGEPASHKAAGWERFTDTVISKLSSERVNLVFLLWGKFAQQKEVLIDTNKHLVLRAAHPSPFSAHSGFMGCRHFSAANSYLATHGHTAIDWTV
jgi:uracil-DNA glycosylase